MTFSPESHSSSGENDKYAEAWERTPSLLPVADNRVQVLLAKTAFPQGNTMEDWIAPEEKDGNSLSERFRAYIESPDCPVKEIDIHDMQATTELLNEIRSLRMPYKIHTPRVETLLMSVAYPYYEQNRVDLWSAEGLADRYRAYCESHRDEAVDLNNEEGLEALMEKVRTFPPATVH